MTAAMRLPTESPDAPVVPSSSSVWRARWSRYDLGNLALLAALIVVLVGIEQVAPHRRFLYNDSDPAINYPLLAEDVPMWLLVLLVGLLPVAIILAIYVYQRRCGHAKRELYYVMYGWAYSMVLTLIMTAFIKRVTGRPRPNFVELSGYQADGTFTGSDHAVRDAFQSFPSGHTSSAFSGLGYLALYFVRLSFPLTFRTRELATAYHVNQGWKTVVCLLPVGLATWIGLTRITNYWHGYDDVSIGAILGVCVAALTFQLHVNFWWESLHPEEGRAEHLSRDLSGDSESRAIMHKGTAGMRPIDVAPVGEYSKLSTPGPSHSSNVAMSPTMGSSLLQEADDKV